jgi:uncharacterized protein involved in outer membrane biogenesis
VPGLRRRRRGISWSLVTLVVATLVVGTTLVVRLPEIVRRVVVTELTRRTGRQVSLEDVDLNPFTAHLALKRFRIGRRGGPAPEIEFERLDLRVVPWALLRRELRLREIALEGPTIRSNRIGPTRLELSDLLDLLPAGDPTRPSRWTFTVERLAIRGGAIVSRDLMTSPHTDWGIERLTVEGRGITSRKDAPPGRLTATCHLNGTHTQADVTHLRLDPLALSGRIRRDPFPIMQLAAYLPPTAPILPRAGTSSYDLEIALQRDGRGLKSGSVSGDLRFEDVQLVARTRHDPFLTAGRLRVAIERLDLITLAVTLDAIELAGLDLRASRDRAGRIHLVDLQPAGAATPGPARETPAPGPSPQREIRLGRLSVTQSAVRFADEAVSPPRQWLLENIALDASGLSTVDTDGPGRIALTAQLRPARARTGATVSVRSDDVRLVPPSASARASVTRLDLSHVDPYVPATVDLAARSGSADVALDLAFEQGPEGLRKGLVSGDVRIAKLTLEPRSAPRPLASLAKLLVAVTRADLVKHDIRLGAIELDGLRLEAVRSPQGQIDLLALVASDGGPAPPAPSAGPAPHASQTLPGSGAREPRLTLAVDRVKLANSAVRFRDAAVSPSADLELSDISAVVRDLTWPSRAPAKFETAFTLPGQGRLEAKGDARLQPLDAAFAMTLRGGVIAPFQPYLPFAARVSGVFNGDSQNTLTLRSGRLEARSTGRTWIDHLELVDPDEEVPPVRIERLDMDGIDFAWPARAKASRVTITRPELHVVREADGAIKLRKLLDTRQRMGPPVSERAGEASGGTDAGGDATEANAADGDGLEAADDGPGQAPTPEAPRSEPEVADGASGSGLPAQQSAVGDRPFPLEFEFGSILIEDAYARFLDRTTRPAFSEAFSKLNVSIEGLSSAPGERARVAAQGLIGERGGLDLRGEVSPFGEPLFADLSVEVRDFSLSDVNPYADKHTSWIVEEGSLAARVRYTIEGNTLTATNDVVVGGLEVARSEGGDEVKRRIGLPLGLIIALVKDLDGDIKLSVPITGTLNDPKFDWSDAIWTAVKNVLVNVVVAPFKAIGKLFTKDDKIESIAIDPVPFAPAGAVIGPAVERQLTGVADFLRKAPFIKVALAPVATTADLDRLRAQALGARLQQLQAERGLRDYSEVVGVAFRAEFPDQPPEPETDEQRLAMLAEREPLPEGAVEELLRRRVEAVRENLVKTEGIQPERVLVGEPVGQVQESGDGRVEFQLR